MDQFVDGAVPLKRDNNYKLYEYACHEARLFHVQPSDRGAGGREEKKG